MTNIELRFFESAIHFFTRRDKEIDWEQRKYEIAKEVLPTLVTHYLQYQNDGVNPAEQSIKDAISIADDMVEKLKAE